MRVFFFGGRGEEEGAEGGNGLLFSTSAVGVQGDDIPCLNSIDGPRLADHNVSPTKPFCLSSQKPLLYGIHYTRYDLSEYISVTVRSGSFPEDSS